MTENLATTHLTVPAQQAFGTVGLPYDGVQCRLDPSDDEIQVKSPATMLGYYKEPEMTRRAFTDDGWMHTGDKGVLDAAGNLKITGRVKDLFKTSKGKYVAPSPIEELLVMHAAVEACCVTGANLGQPIGLLMLNDEAVRKPHEPAGRVELETSLAEHLKAINRRSTPTSRLDCLVADDRGVDGGQRPDHADLEGQAQPHRRRVLAQLRALGPHGTSKSSGMRSKAVGIPIPMLDLMFFLTEKQDNPRHVGAVLIFERPRRGGAAVVRRIVEAYRQADSGAAVQSHSRCFAGSACPSGG